MDLQPRPKQYNNKKKLTLTKKQIASVVYHSKFKYPLNENDLEKWIVGSKFPVSKYQKEVSFKNGFCFVKGENEILTRLKREKYSKHKMVLANKVAKFLKKFPTIKFVGVTGSLAMENADSNSDIDLIVITSKDTLWLTRGFVLLATKVAGFKLRKAGEEEEKDKLCFNLWMDESDLKWKEKNEFMSHEIAQIIPLVNEDNVFEKFLNQNKWILDYWPKSIIAKKVIQTKKDSNLFLRILNNIAFKLQYLYMQSKITKEVILKTRAQFHPNKIIHPQD